MPTDQSVKICYDQSNPCTIIDSKKDVYEPSKLFTPSNGSLALQRLDPDARRHLATSGGGRSRRRARRRQPAGAQAAALSGEGQTCDLHLPARRLFACGFLRLQTEADRRREERPFVSGQ